jgi:hypothetical protein
MSDWAPVPKPVPPEFVTGFPHATFLPEPARFATWAEQLELAEFAALKSWANGGIGQPETD